MEGLEEEGVPKKPNAQGLGEARGAFQTGLGCFYGMQRCHHCLAGHLWEARGRASAPSLACLGLAESAHHHHRERCDVKASVYLLSACCEQSTVPGAVVNEKDLFRSFNIRDYLWEVKQARGGRAWVWPF